LKAVLQAVILCGGQGERLRPLTDNKPKSMIELNGCPFLPNCSTVKANWIFSQSRKSGIKEFKLYNGESQLDFFPVETVASSLLKLLAERGVGLVNIGSAKPRLVQNFAQDLVTSNAWDVSLFVDQKSDRSYESREFWADISKLHRVSKIRCV